MCARSQWNGNKRFADAIFEVPSLSSGSAFFWDALALAAVGVPELSLAVDIWACSDLANLALAALSVEFLIVSSASISGKGTVALSSFEVEDEVSWALLLSEGALASDWVEELAWWAVSWSLNLSAADSVEDLSGWVAWCLVGAHAVADISVPVSWVARWVWLLRAVSWGALALAVLNVEVLGSSAAAGIVLASALA